MRAVGTAVGACHQRLCRVESSRSALNRAATPKSLSTFAGAERTSRAARLLPLLCVATLPESRANFASRRRFYGMERDSDENKAEGRAVPTACSSRNNNSMTNLVKRQKLRHRAMPGDEAPVGSADDAPQQVEDSIPACVASSAPPLTCHIPGLLMTDHSFKVPLDHWNPGSKRITIFAREVVAYNKVQRQLPYLLYLQGGPGFEAPRPTEASGWLKAATNHFRVVLLDQRGTGRSTGITSSNLHKQGDAAAQAEYLKHFRADSIVADCEALRQKLVPVSNQGGKWSLLGQSFGGFCCLSYLSFAPHGLTEVMLTGGVPPLITEQCGAQEAYRRLFERVITQNKRYYQRFSGDKAIVTDIIKYLAAQPGGGAALPSGSLLSPRLFQTLGLAALGGGGGFERLHYLLENAWDGSSGEPSGGPSEAEDGAKDDARELSYGFLKACDNWGAWDTNPLFLLLHEAIYCNGKGPGANWAAQQVRDSDFSATFDALAAAEEGGPVYFTGVQVYPFMLDDIAALRPYKETADLVAECNDWKPLYDLEVLERNSVPVAAAVYYDDMYVDFDLSQDTLSHVRGARQWISNEFLHSGIRDDGARIFDHLLNLVRGSVPLR